MTSLADKVARVKELQANCYPDGIKDAQALGYAIFMFKQEADNMAALISQLWEENQKQREVLVMAREAMQAEATKMMYAMMNRAPLDYDIGLAKERLVNQVTAIDNVMKVGG